MPEPLGEGLPAFPRADIDTMADFLLPHDIAEKTFIVIAAYNEETCIADVVTQVRQQFPNVVVVDDGSTDATYANAKRASKYTLRHFVNRGQGAALQTGIEFALDKGAEYIVTFDADGQHRVEDIEHLLAPLCRGECHYALGSRFLGTADGVPFSKKMTLRLAVLFTRVINRVQLTDTHNGLRAFSRQGAKRVQITLDRMAHASELIDQIRHSGLAYTEVPVQIRYTEYSIEKGQNPLGAFRIVMQYLLGRISR